MSNPAFTCKELVERNTCSPWESCISLRLSRLMMKEDVDTAV
jgi:hypothetical protein